MIDQITDLTNKTNELENKLQELIEQKEKDEIQTNSLSFSRNYSNLEIIMPNRILVARINPQQNSNILFQCQLDMNLSDTENVEITFIVNKFAIYKTNKVLSAGSNQLSIMQNFKPLDSSKLSVYIEINPTTQKPINLNNISLFAWGNLDGNFQIDYQVVELTNKYLISINDSNSIYAIQTNKEINEYNLSDLNFVNSGLSHKFVYDEDNDTIYLFRVDLNGNLFYSNIDNMYEIFLENNVSNVSADISASGKILVTYIKNNECYFFEIDENQNISIHKKLYANRILVEKSICYYNKFRSKFMIILSSANKNNYVVEQINEDYLNSDTVTAQYGFFVTNIDEND